MAIMRAIPSTVKTVTIDFNKLDPTLMTELLNSRGQAPTLTKPTQPVKKQAPKIGKPKEEKAQEEKPVRISSVSQTQFASKQSKTSSSAPKDEADTSFTAKRN